VTTTVFATTPEQRARELANVARWEATQYVDEALTRLDLALKDSARFALSQSTVPSQKRGDRHWYRLLVVSHLAATVAAIGHADDHAALAGDIADVAASIGHTNGADQ